MNSIVAGIAGKLGGVFRTESESPALVGLRAERERIIENLAIEERDLANDESLVRAKRRDPSVLDDRRRQIEHLRQHLASLDVAEAQEREIITTQPNVEASLSTKAQQLVDLLVPVCALAREIQKEHAATVDRYPSRGFKNRDLMPMLGSGGFHNPMTNNPTMIGSLADPDGLASRFMDEARRLGLSVPDKPIVKMLPQRQHAAMNASAQDQGMDAEERRIRRVTGTLS